MGGHEQAPPTAILGLAFKSALDDNASCVQVEFVARCLVHLHREDQVPAVVAAVGEVVIARVVAIVSVRNHPRGFK